MKRLAFLFTTLATPAWAHVHAVNFDFVCTNTDTVPGLVLLPFLLLAGVGVARAVARHRRDRAPSPNPRCAPHDRLCTAGRLRRREACFAKPRLRPAGGGGEHRESLTRLLK